MCSSVLSPIELGNLSFHAKFWLKRINGVRVVATLSLFDDYDSYNILLHIQRSTFSIFQKVNKSFFIFKKCKQTQTSFMIRSSAEVLKNYKNFEFLIEKLLLNVIKNNLHFSCRYCFLLLSLLLLPEQRTSIREQRTSIRDRRLCSLAVYKL
jgi:hypothetical protein